MDSVLVWRPKLGVACSRLVALRVASVSLCRRSFGLDTIKSSAEISVLFKQGRRFNTPYLTLIVFRNKNQHGQHGRVAFIASKRLGNAVWRNRAKRRLRSVCRDSGMSFAGFDVIFLAKSRLTEGSYEEVCESCSTALKRAGFSAA